MGGGAMMDMGVYPLQAASYVTGEEPVSVTAQTFTTRPGKIQVMPMRSPPFSLNFPAGPLPT